MASIGRAPGPLPHAVYRRRRLLVVGGLLAVLAVILLIVFRPTGTSTAGAPGPAESSPSTGPQPAGPVACAEGTIEIVPLTDAESYAEGVLPQLSFSLTNVGADDCVINVGTSQQVYTITSGPDIIWTSSDCLQDPADQELTLAAGRENQVSPTPITWERQRSAPETCDDPDRPAVDAAGASYHLEVSVGGFTSAETAQFILE